MNEGSISLLAQILHDIINEIIYGDDKANENLARLQQELIKNFIRKER